LVLTDSPRAVRPLDAARLAGAAGAVLTVGIFSVEPAARVAAATRAAGVRAVQLSAGADGPSVSAVRAALGGLPAPLVIAAADTPDVAEADLVLLDARLPGVYGGTGTTLDWRAFAAGAGPRATLRPVALAGGLAPGNVGAAIAALRPYAVDVSGGVESSPGVKDAGLLAAFVAAVAAADAACEAAEVRR
jgi:phosphoribosylanthranilate isomerase